jgi:hypothetical protein
MRTYAFLGRKRWMGITLVTLFLGETAFLLYVSIAGIHQTILPVVTKGPCTASDKPGQHVVSGFWLAPVAFDLLCTFTTVYKVRIRFPERCGYVHSDDGDLVGNVSRVARVAHRQDVHY